jgi:predicted translin family RNA/ssDNA-binding protein
VISLSTASAPSSLYTGALSLLLHRSLLIASRPRIVEFRADSPAFAESVAAAQQMLETVRLSHGQSLARHLAACPEPLALARTFSPGLQEFIEAVLFAALVSNGQLPSPTEVAASLRFTCGFVPVSCSDYLLGLADTTGELMRMCVSATAAQQLDLAQRLLSHGQDIWTGATTRTCRAVCSCAYPIPACSSLRFVGAREWKDKLEVMAESIAKMERSESSATCMLCVPAVLAHLWAWCSGIGGFTATHSLTCTRRARSMPTVHAFEYFLPARASSASAVG